MSSYGDDEPGQALREAAHTARMLANGINRREAFELAHALADRHPTTFIQRLLELRAPGTRQPSVDRMTARAKRTGDRPEIDRIRNHDHD